ncbi:MAG: type II secretion system protein [Kiritimatiellia bacterium]
MKTNSRSAFTLIELLVVIGIIGILSAVMLGLLSGSGNAARATQCMTNMRGLSVAVLNYAMQNNDGHFPPAGSFKWTDYSHGVTYATRQGWISWNKGGNEKSKACPSYITFNEGDRELLRYAITNGCIWATGGKTEKTYQCPIHDAACLKANKRHPGWSYVMNESFYWNSEGKPFSGWRSQRHGGINAYDATSKKEVKRPPEKVLLFAEIQGLDDATRNLRANTDGNGTKGDCVLQYKSDNEGIGFNHVQSGGKLSGHVAFADGHVEKFMYPANGDVQQLTKWLCSGREVSFNGTNYQDIQGSN